MNECIFVVQNCCYSKCGVVLEELNPHIYKSIDGHERTTCEGPLGGHFAIEIMKRKILDVGYWWPMLYIDVNDYYKSRDA